MPHVKRVMLYEIQDDFGGVRNGAKYNIEDTAKTENEWNRLLQAFCDAFPEFTKEAQKDYELADWHHGMRVIPAYLHNEGFYNDAFIPKVQEILLSQKNDSYAQFECYNSSKRLIGQFMVFSDTVIFDRLSEQTGLLQRLVKKDSKNE